ncbi:hypothetical protein [Tenacibaculum ovolyticum]|uniref:hypothetical protein n=1 Tax=Tenacibaculum ovolyticum TaxID=104270 RepID=UPI003BA9B284
MNESLGNISNINLAFLGICLTLFTVIYSFILNYRETLKENTLERSLGNNSPSLKQKISFLKKNIKTFKSVNYHLKIIIYLSFIQFLIPILTIDFIDCMYYKGILVKILKISFYLEMIYMIVLLFRIMRFYEKQTK